MCDNTKLKHGVARHFINITCPMSESASPSPGMVNLNYNGVQVVVSQYARVPDIVNALIDKGRGGTLSKPMMVQNPQHD